MEASNNIIRICIGYSYITNYPRISDLKIKNYYLFWFLWNGNSDKVQWASFSVCYVAQCLIYKISKLGAGITWRPIPSNVFKLLLRVNWDLSWHYQLKYLQVSSHVAWISSKHGGRFEGRVPRERGRQKLYFL